MHVIINIIKYNNNDIAEHILFRNDIKKRVFSPQGEDNSFDL